jgi:hypothetical protein
MEVWETVIGFILEKSAGLIPAAPSLSTAIYGELLLLKIRSMKQALVLVYEILFASVLVWRVPGVAGGVRD